jgi:hypothetical protein
MPDRGHLFCRVNNLQDVADHASCPRCQTFMPLNPYLQTNNAKIRPCHHFMERSPVTVSSGPKLVTTKMTGTFRTMSARNSKVAVLGRRDLSLRHSLQATDSIAVLLVYTHVLRLESQDHDSSAILQAQHRYSSDSLFALTTPIPKCDNENEIIQST